MSPEGQAFVMEMQAAWRDWVEAGSKGKNGAVGGRMIVDKGGGWVLVGMAVWVGCVWTV